MIDSLVDTSGGGHSTAAFPRNAQFMLATADEREVKTATEIAHKTGVPTWRVALGNIAAGATAGCAVEAGKIP